MPLTSTALGLSQPRKGLAISRAMPGSQPELVAFEDASICPWTGATPHSSLAPSGPAIVGREPRSEAGRRWTWWAFIYSEPAHIPSLRIFTISFLTSAIHCRVANRPNCATFQSSGIEILWFPSSAISRTFPLRTFT